MEYRFSSTEKLLKFSNEELLSAVEAIEILGNSKARVGQLVKEGKLIAAKEQPKMFLRSMLLDRERIRVPSKKI